MSKLALIIDDEPDIRELLDITLTRMSINSHCAENLSAARELLKKNEYDICLTDMKLPDGNGVDFVNEILGIYPKLPVAVITAHGNMDTAITALKYGAFDFLTKPVDLKVLRALVNDALNLSRNDVADDQTLIGQSPIITALRAKIGKLARSQAPIYVSGESGTGKELVARLIHNMGARAGYPFVPVNCGAIPHELMESEFFGHTKGSFTGAVSDKGGLFQAAEGGTLFLDEIADLPQNIQVKLLRAIQEKKVRPIGAQQEIPVNVRILSATHKNLAELVDKGIFRQDLFYRINVIELNVPPLRERKDDIPLLAQHIMDKLNVINETHKVSISDEAMSILMTHDYPGNIRELENMLERAITMCEADTITPADIGLEPVQGNHTMHIPDLANSNLEEYLAGVEKKAIMDALAKTNGNKTAAAKLLGISFRALRYRMEKLELDA